MKVFEQTQAQFEMMTVTRCLYVWIFVIKACSGEVSILLDGVDIAKLQNDNSIKIIEGERLRFDCTYDTGNTDVIWTRNNSVVRRNSNLELESVRFEDEGLYTCTVTSAYNSTSNSIVGYQSIFVKVLYPPSFPVIEFPTSVLSGEELSLTYKLHAEPDPTYQWRQFTSNGLLLSRNRTYHMTVPSISLRIYCIIQSLMIPTLGEPRTTILSPYVFLNIHRKAIITSVYPGRYIHKTEGEDIFLRCHVDGDPFPKVWWTKIGDESFYWPSEKYSSYNIDTSSAGMYVCHAENTVVPANKTQVTVLSTEVFYVFIKGSINQKPKINCTNCTAQCTFGPNLQHLTPSSTMSPSVASESVSSKTVNCSTEKEVAKYKEKNQENDITFISLVVATVIGWTISLVMIGVNLYYWKKCKNTKQKDGGMRSSSSSTENQTTQNGVSSSYVFNVRVPDNTYTDITTYDQISSGNNSINQPGRASPLDWNDSESISTQTSVVTYMEPI